MSTPDSDAVHRELLALLDKQFESLELSDCVTPTDDERREYDTRKQRIKRLFEQLHVFKASAIPPPARPSGVVDELRQEE